MRTREKVIIAAVILPLAAFTAFAVGLAYYMTRPPRELPGIPQAVVEQRFRDETTFATARDVQTKVPPVALEEIVSETTGLGGTELHTAEGRRAICVRLFRGAGFDPVVTEDGDVLVYKQGRTVDYVAVGAHYDKVDGPSEGILDNMLGCILVSNIAKALRDEPTNYTYLFLAYGNEETGRRIGSAIRGYESGRRERPTYIIEIDYVGDKDAELGGRWMSPIDGRFLQTGIKINTIPMPDPRKIHTEKDNLSNVHFGRAYLAYKTVISLIEGIERGEGLKPPDTVNFWRKENPLFGCKPAVSQPTPSKPIL
ncbi:MAG: M28 family peptidase [Phycisphaerae bacterium]|nr:M28 family peptidase [Phycisphaerae bacterium]